MALKSQNRYNRNLNSNMADYQQKYLEQKRKCDNLLKMQNGIFNDIDEYSNSIIAIRNYVRTLQAEQPEQHEELTPETAAAYAQEIIDFIRKLGRPCECNRWKSLYHRQSQQNLKLTHNNESLLKKLKEKEEQESKDRVEILQLFNDYMELFRKQFEVREPREQQKKKEKKEAQSRSKSKNKPSSQTERKHIKNASGLESKDEQYTKMMVEKFERDVVALHGDLEELRDKNLQLEQILRIYRTKERNHLLDNDCKWFQ